MYDNDHEADAYEPGDPKSPGFEQSVTDRADTLRDEISPAERPPMSPLGNVLFQLASTEGMQVAARLAGLQYADEYHDDEDEAGQ